MRKREEALLYAIGNIEDSHIIAVVAGKSHTHLHRWMKAGIAVCLAFAAILGAFKLQNGNVREQEPFTEMSLLEVNSSPYANYIPNLEEMGYELDTAGFYGEEETTFRASFVSGESSVTIRIVPYSEEQHGEHIVDMETVDETIRLDDPVFTAEQFDSNCLDYAEVTTSDATGKNTIAFSVLMDSLVAKYTIEVSSAEEAVQVVECISLCYES